MKLAPILVQYLHKHKRLDLPGIGTFLLHEPAYTGPETHKHDKQAGQETVSFENNTAIKQSPDLVQFIADQTGKIKALASADLESHLELAQQLLNIGNPFLFEGIGSLEKIRSGEYALAPGSGMEEKTKEYGFRDKPGNSASGESPGDYKKVLYPGDGRSRWRKPVVIALIVAGLALAVWGGYTVYERTTAKNKSADGDKNKKENALPVQDTAIHQKDSVIIPVQQPPAGMHKYVLEIAGAKRANERYKRLKAYEWNVQLETKDSLTYKLFMLLPSSAGDTSHIADSLSQQNGRRVIIEY